MMPRGTANQRTHTTKRELVHVECEKREDYIYMRGKRARGNKTSDDDRLAAAATIIMRYTRQSPEMAIIAKSGLSPSLSPLPLHLRGRRRRRRRRIPLSKSSVRYHDNDRHHRAHFSTSRCSRVSARGTRGQERKPACITYDAAEKEREQEAEGRGRRRRGNRTGSRE